MSLIKFEILSSGSYLPSQKVGVEELAKKTNKSVEWIMGKSGVETRYFAGDESLASMGAKAVNKALENCSFSLNEIDLLIAAGGTPDQPIPHNSALIHKELSFPSHITPLDVDATCLSFVQALKIAAGLIHSGLNKNVIIVSSEKSSVGLNYDEPESSTLLGDGAVAFIIGKTDKEKGLIFSEFETYNEGVHLAEITGGGTRFHTSTFRDTQCSDFLFKMNGHKIYKMASQYLPNFFNNGLSKNGLKLEDIDYVVPHQASLMGLRLMCKKLEIPEEKFHINIEKYGNLVGASVPMTLHELLEMEKLKKGDKALLLCSAAGLTLGMMGLQL